MGKHCCASVHLGTGVGKVSRAEHREELLHLVLIKTPMGCEIMLKNVPFHLSILHSAGCTSQSHQCGLMCWLGVDLDSR